MARTENSRDKLFAGLLMFVIGFAGFSILGAIILVLLIALGILPNI
jgi:hypothetical protein